MTVLAILIVYGVSGVRAATIEGATIIPVSLPTPRTINPELLTQVGTNIGYFDGLRQELGIIDPENAIEFDPVRTNFGEKLSIKSFALGPDANLWFAGTVQVDQNVLSVIGRVPLSLSGRPSGNVTLFLTPSMDACTRASAPCELIASDSVLWYTAGATGKIGKATTAGAMTEFQVSGSTVNGIAADADGDVWVSSKSANRVYEVGANGTVIRDFRIGAGRNFVAPGAITAAPDGQSVLVAADGSGGNSITRITTAGVMTEFVLPTANSMPVDLTFGSDEKLYYVAYAAKNLGQLDVATGAFRETPIPNGFNPDEIHSFPPDGAGNVRLVLNTIDPVTFDSTPQRVTVGAEATQPRPDLTIEKLPSGDDMLVDEDDEDSPRIVRHAHFATFSIRVKNVGNAPTVGVWEIVETTVDGLGPCRERFSEQPRMEEKRDSKGDLVLTVREADPARILAPGQFFSVQVSCKVFAEVSGYITNTARVRGGDSSEDSAQARVFGLSRRDVRRLNPDGMRRLP